MVELFKQDYFLPLLLLSVLVLLLICLFSLAALFKQIRMSKMESREEARRSEETILEYTEQALRDMETRIHQNSGIHLSTLQHILSENRQNDASQTASINARLESSLSSQENRIRHLSDVLGERLLANDEKVDRMRETLSQNLNLMRTENAAKLDEMRKTVDENLHQTLNRRLGESFSLVNERLEQVYQGLGEMKTLANGVGDLKRVLTNVKVRGIWGEVQLGALLGDLLAPGQYESNVCIRPGTQERVEFAIRLPGQDGMQPLYLPIDAKFPLEAYYRTQEAAEKADKAAEEQAKGEFISTMLKEAMRISSKYIVPPTTTDFAIMYLPTESLYGYAAQIGGLTERLQREHRVSLAGPSTLSALLNSLQMGFRTLAVEQRSGEVWQLLGTVKKEFASFGDMLEKTKQKLLQASDSIDTATRKTRTIERTLKAVETLDSPAETETTSE